jgi:hypothetical protein
MFRAAAVACCIVCLAVLLVSALYFVVSGSLLAFTVLFLAACSLTGLILVSHLTALGKVSTKDIQEFLHSLFDDWRNLLW